MMVNPDLNNSTRDVLVDLGNGLKLGQTRTVNLDVTKMPFNDSGLPEIQMSPGADGATADLTGYTDIHTATAFYVQGTITLNRDNSYTYNLTYTLIKDIKPSSNHDLPAPIIRAVTGGVPFILRLTWSAVSTRGGRLHPNAGWPWGIDPY
jgi:hypothetical protein